MLLSSVLLLFSSSCGLDVFLIRVMTHTLPSTFRVLPVGPGTASRVVGDVLLD